MNQKTTKIIFWVTTAIIFLTQCVVQLVMFKNPKTVEGMAQLGYPSYFGVMLTVFKVLGAIALIVPQIPGRIKEWAYAGFAIDFIAAFVSLVAVGGMGSNAFMAIIFMGILVASYLTYHKLNDSGKQNIFS